MNSPNPLVSVVIPTRNRRDLVRLALASVLRQTYSNFEILVVDDGSGDDTETVVRAFEDPRIRYFRPSCRVGVSGGRNYAARRAHGEYLAFLDSDDEWLPTKLERQVGAFRSAAPEVALVYTGMIFRSDSGQERIRIARHSGWIPDAVLRYNPIGTPSRVMLRRSCFDAAGGFDESLTAHEDWELYIRITRRWPVEAVPEALVLYREHAASISGAPFRNLEGRLQLWRKSGIDAAPRGLRSFHYARLAHDLSYRGAPAELGVVFFLRAFLIAPWRLDYVFAALIVAASGAKYHRLAFQIHRLADRFREFLPMY